MDAWGAIYTDHYERGVFPHLLEEQHVGPNRVRILQLGDAV